MRLGDHCEGEPPLGPQLFSFKLSRFAMKIGPELPDNEVILDAYFLFPGLRTKISTATAMNGGLFFRLGII